MKRRVFPVFSIFLVLTGLGLGFGLVLDFTSFYRTMTETRADSTARTGAIVVLTGSSDRLYTGLHLLHQDLADKLFISGVHSDVSLTELLLRINPDETQHCCIVLGYEAQDTAGNALETRAWMEAEGYRSLRLVTSAYHMPRSLLEFKRAMPEIEILPHPVFPKDFAGQSWWAWPGGKGRLLLEYGKYRAATLGLHLLFTEAPQGS